MTPIFKIIVPVYNVEPYLHDCLLSIQQQTHPDFLCLVIDDGSKDGSTGIAQIFCQQDPRFQYHAKPNGGLSDARNFGIALCDTDDYIILIDSDDLIQPQLLEFTLNTLKTNRTDLIMYDFQRIKHDTSLEEFTSKFTYNSQTLSKEIAIKQQNFSWARICKKSFYADNLFPVGLIYEDVAVSPLLTAKSTHIIMITAPLYGYRRREGSITTESADKQFKIFDALDLLKERCISQNIPETYYTTTKVSVLQSCILSALRLKSNTASWYKLRLTQNKYQDIDLIKGWRSFSSISKKTLLTIIKLGPIGAVCCLIILKPLFLKR